LDTISKASAITLLSIFKWVLLSFVGFQHLIWVNFQSRAFDINEAALAQFGQNLVLPTEVMDVR
jgi:uncharacterized membrane protein YccF (DUF307 family)